jgi:AAA+ superfamily predicted ATPase
MIAATNHPELLDKAIWRRFNTVIEVGQPDNDGISRIMEMYLGSFADDFKSDRKKYEKVVNQFASKSPSDIRNVINNAITQAVINGRNKVTLEDLLIEIFQFETRGNFTNENLIKYLNDNGVPKLQIADLLNVSIRQIRNNLKD